MKTIEQNEDNKDSEHLQPEVTIRVDYSRILGEFTQRSGYTKSF